MTTKQTQRSRNPDQHYSFGLKDAKGRTIGCVVKSALVEFEPQDADKNWGYTLAPGTYTEVQVQATRNGVDYGASQRRHYFTGELAVASYIQKRVEDSRKAATKKAGK